jgi:hypothetical protein
MLSWRSLITGLVAFAATAPAIVRAASLMPLKSMLLKPPRFVMAIDPGFTPGEITIIQVTASGAGYNCGDAIVTVSGWPLFADGGFGGRDAKAV